MLVKGIEAKTNVGCISKDTMMNKQFEDLKKEYCHKNAFISGNSCQYLRDKDFDSITGGEVGRGLNIVLPTLVLIRGDGNGGVSVHSRSIGGVS